MKMDKQQRDSMRASMHRQASQRRRAASNYQTLEDQVAERRGSVSVSMAEAKSNRLLHANSNIGNSTTTNNTSFAASYDALPTVARSGAVFELLQLKFGFQDGSVRNQREHFDGWVLNYESRMKTPDSHEAVRQIHAKFFKNYVRWCSFLRTKPLLNADGATGETQIALFLLIWGEAGNMRFMPECLCFLYHSMAAKLDDLERLPNVAEGSFLRRVVRPLYNVVAKMRATQPVGTDHEHITNYDDVNEFFWTPRCLDFDELNVAEAVGSQPRFKTFKERRSVFNPLLGFFRIYFFLLVMFHVLVVIAYVAYRSDPALHTGLHFYANFFSATVADLRNHAFFSVLLTVSGLLLLKVVLEVWLGGTMIFERTSYAAALFARLCWHAIFFALFAAVNASPYEVLVGDSNLLSLAPVITGVYMVPVVLAAIMKMGCRKVVWGSTLLNGFDGTSQQFIGRNMGQTWGAFLSYGLFWTILFVLKFAFNLQLMVKPLIGPSYEIYDIHASRKNALIESEHNIAFLMAMWAPIVLVYIYDAQIWLAILQAIVGAWIGIRLKIGNSSRMPEFVHRLKIAHALFEKKVVSHAARGHLSVEPMQARTLSDAASAPDANSRLRFAVVWNEIVSSFRLSDLLDDRESAILQYQISDAGAAEDPVFLIAGHAQTAADIAARAKGRRLDDTRLRKELEKAGVLGCALNAIDICFQILRQLLGPADAPIIQAFEQIIESGKVNGVVNLMHVPLVRENIVDLLASILDLPEPAILPSANGGTQSFFGLQQDQVIVIVQRVDALLKSMELMLEEEWMAERVRKSVFATMTPDLSYQKQQLIALFADRNSTTSNSDGGDDQKASPNSNENIISLSTRLFFLLTLDAADALPRCHEARRRMSFFLNSLSMDMPTIQSIASMHSFSVITPYYNESVLYSIDELNGRVASNPLFRKVEAKGRDLSILKYLITFHSDEWGNFLERVGATSMDEALAETPTQVRLWASMRGQTLARTVQGMMLYEDALKMLRWLEIGSDQSVAHVDKIKQMDRIAGLKFSYVTSCQIYSQQLAKGDSRAADIDLLMRKYPNWRVSYVDTIYPPAGSAVEPRYDCVLIKSDGDEIVEVYRYELPGNPMVGEGKPENQNIAMPFTRGEYVQTIDMNQEHYFEEALKIPNFLATATANGADVTIIGMKEHIFTGRASSLAHFMTLQELVFVSLTQRVMAHPLHSRMHYGHPDVFDKSFVMHSGGVSKASKGINLSEDVFSGYNAALRGEHVTHVEFMQCGKGRDVTLSQINAFEAKLANGSAESSLSRESHRMAAGMDFFRLNSMFYGHMGFYICNALVVLCVFVYSYSKLYIVLHESVQSAAIVKTGSLDDLADVLNTQFIFQFGMLMTIPLIATLFVEYGWRQAIMNFVELIITLGPFFYIFETGTKAHFFDVALMRGGSKYRGTGRGFAIIRETMVNFYKEYAASHYRKAAELLGLMIIFGVYGNFSIGTNARTDYCEQMGLDCTKDDVVFPQNITLLEAYGSKGQDYGIASFAVWLLGGTWLLAPFFFNTDGLDFPKTRVDIGNWLYWMMAIPGANVETLPSAQRSAPSDTWIDFYNYEMELVSTMRWTARIAYALRELRHPLTMYYIFMVSFDLSDLALLGACVGGVTVLLWIGGFVLSAVTKNKAHVARGVLYLVLVIGGIVVAPIIVGSTQGWGFKKSASLVVGIFLGLFSVLQYLTLLHGIMGVPVAKLGLVMELAFFFDMTVGLFLIVPLLVLSAFPFMRTIQTRMMYNVSFTRALSTGSEFAASLSVVVGLLGGWSYGWLYCLTYSLGYVNSASDNFINESFIYFVNEALGAQFEKEMLKVFAALAGAVGAVLGTWLAHMMGRRIAIMASCVLVFGGVGLVFVTSSSLILIGCCLVLAGISMLAVACVLYNYEICMKGWKGKGVLLFLLGVTLGYFVEAIIQNGINATAMRKGWSNKPLHVWRYQFVFGAIPLVVLMPLMFILPESPIWQFRRRDIKAAEATLVRLRQKHDVLDEMDDLKMAFVNKGAKINIPFRVVLVMALQATYALLTSGVLLRRVLVQPAPEFAGAQTSRWMIYFGGMSFTGVLLSLLTVDNVRRKTILKDLLPFSAAVSLACGVLDSAKLESAIIDILLFVLFTSSALCLTCATWLTAIEVFPPYQSSRWVALSFAFYYLVQAALFVTLPSFAISHYVFTGLCLVLTIAMFGICASTKSGAIQLKSEKKRRMQAARSSDELDNDDDEVSAFVARVSRSQSFLRSRVRRSSQMGPRTPGEGGDYEVFETPAAHEKDASRQRQRQRTANRSARRTKNRSAFQPDL